MKKLICILLTIIIAGCSSSKHYIKKGRYDLAVQSSMKVLLKKRSNPKEISNLEMAYNKANQADLDKIKLLKVQGSANRWEEIFQTYTKLYERQQYVKKVLPLSLNGKNVEFEMHDYTKDISESRGNAIEYFYANAKKQIGTGSKEASRNAFYELKKVKSMEPNYKDVDQLMQTARDQGISTVIVTIQNSTPFKLSSDFKENILHYGAKGFDDEWVKYTVKPVHDYKNYDYDILFNLKIIDVSPEKIKEERHIEKRSIKDGWEYALDSKGNVRKDSLGNDIKKPKYKTISCEVIETIQLKSAHIEGFVEFIDNQGKRTLKKEPVAADHFFDYRVLIANGDLNALKEETRKQIGGKPVPFPSDLELIYGAGETIGNVVRDIINRNKYYLK